MESNELILSLCIWDFEDITHEQITELTGYTPVKTYTKGERMRPDNPRLARQSGWIMESGYDQYTDFDTQMSKLLDMIEAKKEVFRTLCSKYNCEFSCAIFIYFDNGESTPWVHLDSRYNQITKDLDISFDVDLYCLSADDSEE